MIVSLLPNIKVSPAGLVYINLRNQTLLSASRFWSEALRSLSTSPTTRTGKESLKLLRVWAGKCLRMKWKTMTTPVKKA